MRAHLWHQAAELPDVDDDEWNEWLSQPFTEKEDRAMRAAYDRLVADRSPLNGYRRQRRKRGRQAFPGKRGSKK